MTPTEQLKEEHQAIKLMLKILEAISLKLEKGKKVDLDHLEKILDFIRVFADRCHHAKEENSLFIAMEKAGIPKEAGPIGMMLEEHNLGRDYVKAMGQAVIEYKKGEKGASEDIVENSRSYISLLDQHIDKEDNILYPMAEAHLSDWVQKELLGQFEKIEAERIGSGQHEAFHKLLHQLKKIYLK